MRLTKGFKRSDLKKEQKILVYGAGRYGEIALRGLELEGLCVDFFVDRAYVGDTYFGIPVIAPEEVKKHVGDAILIASYNYFYDILAYLQSIGVEEIFDIELQLLADLDENKLTEYALDEKKNFQKYINVINSCGGHELVLGHCEVVVTERCTLKCRDCANLMQYYDCPSALDIRQIIQSFNRFLETIDVLLEMRILGGEPFLCRDLDQIIHEYVHKDKIKRITIYTNSTILPEQKILQALKNEKISVHMSNYGKYSRNLDALDKTLTDNGINHYVHHYEDWFDLGDLSKRCYPEESLKQMFKSCYMAKCYTFYREKFYICPRAAHGEQLGVFVNQKNEVVDFSVENIDMEQKRKEIKKIISDIDFITACGYCDGCNARAKNVVAAVQMKR